MSNTAEVQFVGSAQQLMAEYDKLKGKNQQLERDLKAVGQASKQANADQKQLARDAKAAIEATLSPLERYRKQMEQLKAALRDGLISQEQFNRANRQAHEDLRLAKEAADGLGRAAKKTFEETRTPLEKYNAQLSHLRELLSRGKIDQDTFNRAVKKQDDVLRAAQPTLEMGIAAAGKYALGLAGIGTAASGLMLLAQNLKAEYDALVERQRQALGETEDYGTAFGKTLTAFERDASIGDEQQLDAELQRIALGTGTKPAIVARVAEAALSSKGSLTNKQATGAVEQALRLLPGDEGAALASSGVILELAQQTDVKDPKALAGFVSQAKAATKISNDQGFGQSFTAGTLSAMVRGDTPEQAAEVFATVGNLMGDREGMRTRTATIQLAEQLAEAFPKLPSTSARIKHLQQNPKLAEGFLADANFEVSAQAFMEKLLKGSPDALAIQAAAERDIAPLTAERGAAFDQRVARNRAAPHQQTVQAGRDIATARDVFQLASGRQAAIGQLREQLFTGDEAVTKQINFPGIDDANPFGMLPIGTRSKLLDDFEKRARNEDLSPSQVGRLTVGAIKRGGGELTDEHLQMLERVAKACENMSRKPSPWEHLMPSVGLNRSN